MQRKIPVVIIHAMFRDDASDRSLPVRRAGGGEAAPCFFAQLSLPEGVFSGHGVVGTK
jgi:hypothetical protein